MPKDTHLAADVEAASRIANLKGEALEKYIEEAEAVIEFADAQLEGGRLTDKERQALQLTKKALEDILEIIMTNRSS